jgi:hypothetical protein
MAAQFESDVLRLRMQKIRNRMHAQVDELRLDAGSLLDWRSYACRFPLSSTLTAAALGFWLMPGHKVTPKVRLTEGTIDQLVERSALQPNAERPPTPWWKPLSRMALDAVKNAAVAYMTRQLLRQTTMPATREPVEATR